MISTANIFLPFGIPLAEERAYLNQRGGKMMNSKIGAMVLAGTFMMTASLPLTALAGPGGRMNGQALQTRPQNTQQIRNQQRLRDGSCVDPARQGSGTMQKRGNTYGPGDGTGNAGSGPKDGSGYGAPSNR